MALGNTCIFVFQVPWRTESSLSSSGGVIIIMIWLAMEVDGVSGFVASGGGVVAGAGAVAGAGVAGAGVVGCAGVVGAGVVGVPFGSCANTRPWIPTRASTAKAREIRFIITHLRGCLVEAARNGSVRILHPGSFRFNGGPFRRESRSRVLDSPACETPRNARSSRAI